MGMHFIFDKREDDGKMNCQRKTGISVYRLCLIGMAVVMNVAGAQLALTLRLPIYLDSTTS